MKTIFEKTNDLLTQQEASKMSGLSVNAIRARRDAGTLKAAGRMRLGRGPMRILFHRKDVEGIKRQDRAFVAAQRQQDEEVSPELAAAVDKESTVRDEGFSIAEARIRSELLNNLSRLPDVMQLAKAQSILITQDEIQVKWEER